MPKRIKIQCRYKVAEDCLGTCFENEIIGFKCYRCFINMSKMSAKRFSEKRKAVIQAQTDTFQSKRRPILCAEIKATIKQNKELKLKLQKELKSVETFDQIIFDINL